MRIFGVIPFIKVALILVSDWGGGGGGDKIDVGDVIRVIFCAVLMEAILLGARPNCSVVNVLLCMK